jgi:hypothetical protein
MQGTEYSDSYFTLFAPKLQALDFFEDKFGKVGEKGY